MEDDPRMDPRKVLRGKCNNCDCEGYQNNEKKTGRANCCYCDCPPPAHERIGDAVQNFSLPVSQSIQVGSDTSVQMIVHITPNKHASNTHKLPPLIVVPHSKDIAANDPGPSNQLDYVASGNQVIFLKPQLNSIESFLNKSSEEITSDDIPMPDVLPDYVNVALQSKKLDAKHRSRICRAVVNKCMDEKKGTNKHLKKAASKILKKYSPMKTKLDPDGVALYKKLVRARDRMNNPTPKCSGQKPGTAALSENEAQQAMFNDWASNKRSVTLMMTYLEASRKQRNKEAKRSKSLDLLINYPALTIPELLLLEFSAMDDVNVSVSRMKQNWLSKLPFVVKFLREQSIYNIGDDHSVEQQTVMVLENLHRIPLFQKGKAKNSLENRACRVLEVFPENTPIAEARPSARDPPRLSGIGNPMGNCSYFAYADSEAIFSTEDPIQGILLLMATYWVFQLNFGAANKLPILFLSACILGPQKIKTYISRNEKFLDFCRDNFDMVV